MTTKVTNVASFNSEAGNASNTGLADGMIRFAYRNLSPNVLSCNFLSQLGRGASGGTNIFYEHLKVNYPSFPNPYNHSAVTITNSGTTLTAATSYQNGVASTPVTYNVTGGWTMISNLQYIVFNPNYFKLNTQQQVSGQNNIYDIRIYDNALTAQNVLDAYNNIAYIT